MTFTDRFSVVWRAYTDKGQIFVEETIGVGSAHKVLYGPVPNQPTAKALIAERKEMVQKQFIAMTALMTQKLEAGRKAS